MYLEDVLEKYLEGAIASRLEAIARRKDTSTGFRSFSHPFRFCEENDGVTGLFVRPLRLALRRPRGLALKGISRSKVP